MGKVILIFTLLLGLTNCGLDTRARKPSPYIVAGGSPLLPKKEIKGCTHPDAINYDNSVQIEDGSCDFNFCGRVNFENTDFDILAIVEAYKKELQDAGIDYIGKTVDDFQCGRALGCNLDTKYTKNYQQDHLENGTCIIQYCGQAGFENSDVGFTSVVDAYLLELQNKSITFSGMVDNNFMCGKKYGCNNQYADNYEAGSIENGTCNFEKKCLNANYENYDQTYKMYVDMYLADLQANNITFTGSIKDNGDVAGICGKMLGCNEQVADNYMAGTKENGKCNFTYCGQAGYENYNASKHADVTQYLNDLINNNINYTGNLDQNNNCGLKLGCNNQYATNYLAGSKENGTCNFQYCGMQNYENYDAQTSQYVQDYLNDLTNNNITYAGTKDNNYNCGGQILTQNFTQMSDNKLDVILVLDNSGSMGQGNEYQNVKNNLDLFIDEFVQEDIDFNISVISSVEDNNTSADYFGRPHANSQYLTKSYYTNSPNAFFQKFEDAIDDLDTLAGGKETSYDAVYKYLYDYDNATYVRPNASLGVLFFSDESDQSKLLGSNIQSYINYFKTKYDKVQLNCLVNKNFDIGGKYYVNTQYGQTTSYKNEYKSRYKNGCESTGGIYEEIIDNSFYQKLQNFGVKAAGIIKTFKLANPAVPGKIDVYVNNVKVTNWTYDAANQSIVFDQAPQFQDMIKVVYVKQ
ncbi:MAG: VWA domain-containing protein [Halobacteriovoraceae bacterium]|nr:VWA domain-containing protein [Halobacteriovoraceae bacterium]MCB9095388.1 VWA domain-containing protein [Halobacteriovoraceae bacterium]